ncbi:hypothetical protein Tco_0132649 [Tanacetum coccineum]
METDLPTPDLPGPFPNVDLVSDPSKMETRTGPLLLKSTYTPLPENSLHARSVIWRRSWTGRCALDCKKSRHSSELSQKDLEGHAYRKFSKSFHLSRRSASAFQEWRHAHKLSRSREMISKSYGTNVSPPYHFTTMTVLEPPSHYCLMSALSKCVGFSCGLRYRHAKYDVAAMVERTHMRILVLSELKSSYRCMEYILYEEDCTLSFELMLRNMCQSRWKGELQVSVPSGLEDLFTYTSKYGESNASALDDLNTLSWDTLFKGDSYNESTDHMYCFILCRNGPKNSEGDRITNYSLMTDYSLWKVILNGNKVLKRKVGETEQEYEPTTAKRKGSKERGMEEQGIQKSSENSVLTATNMRSFAGSEEREKGNNRRTVTVETPNENALVAQDGIGRALRNLVLLPRPVRMCGMARSKPESVKYPEVSISQMATIVEGLQDKVLFPLEMVRDEECSSKVYVPVIAEIQTYGIAQTKKEKSNIVAGSEKDAEEKGLLKWRRVELRIKMGRMIKPQEAHDFEQFSPFKNAFTLPPVSNVTLMNDTGIFGNAYDDEYVGAESNLNHLETTMNVSPIPTTRIDKDHPKDQIIGDLNSAIHTRRMTKISNEHAMMDVKSAFLYGTIEEEDEEADNVDVHLYRSMIRSLMYLTASRPDIMFAVCACARFQVTPKTSHLHAVKRIFRYLKGQPKLGLWYPRDSPFDLEAFSDSDYAGASLDRKSTIGGCQFLGKRLISWQCKKQTIVANSTTEAEYVAAAHCCGQVLWIQNQMLDYGFNFMNTMIYIDNESTICIVKNPVFHSKTKHIEIKHHFIRDCYEKKLIQVIKIHTDHNVADLLTKAFDVSRFNFLIASIGLLNL